jgi:hypothetical protein
MQADHYNCESHDESGGAHRTEPVRVSFKMTYVPLDAAIPRHSNESVSATRTAAAPASSRKPVAQLRMFVEVLPTIWELSAKASRQRVCHSKTT